MIVSFNYLQRLCQRSIIQTQDAAIDVLIMTYFHDQWKDNLNVKWLFRLLKKFLFVSIGKKILFIRKCLIWFTWEC
jgi:hypothetical protein